MKIMYDHQIFTSQRYGGISRYFSEIISGLKKYNDIQIEIPIILSNNEYLKSKQLANFIDLFSNIHFKGKTRLFNLVNKPNTIISLKKQNYDIFHPTYYDPYFIDYIGKTPFVLTVYDMIHEKFPEMFSKKDKTSQYKKLLAEKATKIVAISKSTKKDLIEILGIDELKIDVIYLGSSMFLKQTSSKTKIELPEKYILFVGSRGGYKNFDRFLTGVAPILKIDQNIYVVCVGGGAFNTHEQQKMEELGVRKKIIQYNINDETLPYIYQNALCFVFPSLYEGFGLPILEAFSCGCPLLCTNTSSFPEIAGDAAYYFDPYNSESIYNAILTVMTDNAIREQLIIKGYERLKYFTWERTVAETIKVYESVLK
jgi:glycosyltransferase involved in cell wall biosynthesis